MLKQMHLKNFTVFSDVKPDFSAQLNVIVGENGAGKTHLPKAAYSVMAASHDEGRKPTAETPTKSALQSLLATKLVNVFRPECLGRLARRRQGRERCDVSLLFSDAELNIDFSVATNSKSEVAVGNAPRKAVDVVALSPEKHAYFVEVKDYRHPDTESWPMRSRPRFCILSLPCCPPA
ncbi:AAA family ATPase [Paracidovorax cattleyae]|uniref:AAA domain-containing protein n=1 Tax=Paracidovorax cattleyae TaxID=80868 RepID=A0A1H0V9E0_9BURK|nr:AAA family ATPase [Paracidovorax cattleyae]SDP74964.1 AAA domain-containing protein [Paracidovorax cattleyae]